MYKQLVLIVCFALSATAAAWSQTQARPRAKAPNVATEQARRAEQKSNGAAFSGRGRGSDKDLVMKHRKHKAWKNKLKGKKQHHSPDHGTVRKTAPADPREMQRTPTTRPAQSPTSGPKPKTAPRPRPGAPRG